MKRRTISMEDDDDRRLEALRKAYGLKSASQMVRVLINAAAERAREKLERENDRPS